MLFQNIIINLMISIKYSNICDATHLDSIQVLVSSKLFTKWLNNALMITV